MRKFLLFLPLLLASAFPAFGQTADAVVTQVSGITATATTTYIAATVIGVAILTVGVVVYMSKKGWKLR